MKLITVSILLISVVVAINGSPLDLQLFPLAGILGQVPEKGAMDELRAQNDFRNVNKMKLKQKDLPRDTRLYVPPSQRQEDYRIYYDVDESNSVDGDDDEDD